MALDDRKLNSLGLAKAPADTRVLVAMSGGVHSSVVAAILRDGWAVLLKTPQARGVGNRYMVATNITTARTSPLATEQSRRTTIEYITVDAEASIYVPTPGQFTWDDLVIQQATWDAVVANYVNWNAVPLGGESAANRGLGGL